MEGLVGRGKLARESMTIDTFKCKFANEKGTENLLSTPC